jgi:type IV pilus assembly protein PilO
MELFKDRVVTKTDWLIIGASVLLLVVITAVYAVALSFTRQEIARLNSEVAATQAKLEETRAIAAKRDGLIEELADVREMIASFEEKLPTEKEVPKLLSQFQQIAELSGVKYQAINAEPIDERDLFVRIPFKVRVMGKYPEIGEFLRSLEFGDRFIKVEDLEIGSEAKGDSEANFIISTFMFVTTEPSAESEVTQS